MGIQPSASKTALLLDCPRPFDPNVEVEDSASEAGRYGSAFHSVLAACLRSSEKKPLETSATYDKTVDKTAIKFDVRAAAGELAGHVKGSVKVLRNWLKREKLEILEIEESYAVKPISEGSWRSRKIMPHDDEHLYTVEHGEIPGTVDLIARSANRMRVVVLDHKTGGGESDKFAQPVELPQMRTLGLVARDLAHASYRGRAEEVGIFHADRRGLPIIYSEPYDKEAQRVHSIALRTALNSVGSGFLRPGPSCKYCPARITCPAFAADLLAESTAALVSSANTLAVEPIDPKALLALPTEDKSEGAIEVRAGALYDLLKKFRALDKAGSEEIRRMVKSGSIIETRAGDVLVLREEKFETLSKKSVLEALGPVAGEKELKRLRKLGAIRESTREKLVPTKG